MASCSEDLLTNMASHPAGTEHGLRRVLKDGPMALRETLEALLASLPESIVQRMRQDPRITRFAKTTDDIERAARFSLAIDICHREIQQRRLALLRNASTGTRAPYDQLGFLDLQPDQNYMVSLTSFSKAGDLVRKTGYVGQILSTTGAGNDTYWLLPALYKLGHTNSTAIRLDPFIHGPADTFPFMMYKMDVYGQPLNWDRLESLVAAEHGQMVNHDGLGLNVRTDFVWEPRGNELHFQAEELPLKSPGPLVGCRYLHAIYDRVRKVVTHFDGALRIMDEAQLEQRRAKHVRDAGKIGARVKVFRVDADTNRDEFGTVAKAFFLWNNDLGRYFDCGAQLA